LFARRRMLTTFGPLDDSPSPPSSAPIDTLDASIRIATLAGSGVRVLTSRGDDLTDSDDEMRVAMRQIAGVFSQLEKTRLVKSSRRPAIVSALSTASAKAERPAPKRTPTPSSWLNACTEPAQKQASANRSARSALSSPPQASSTKLASPTMHSQ
jgi:hypothetical protein